MFGIPWVTVPNPCFIDRAGDSENELIRKCSVSDGVWGNRFYFITFIMNVGRRDAMILTRNENV
jgi:hypothetical protein